MPSRQRLTRSQRRQRKVAGYASRALGVAAVLGAGGWRTITGVGLDMSGWDRVVPASLGTPLACGARLQGPGTPPKLNPTPYTLIHEHAARACNVRAHRGRAHMSKCAPMYKGVSANVCVYIGKRSPPARPHSQSRLRSSRGKVQQMLDSREQGGGMRRGRGGQVACCRRRLWKPAVQMGRWTWSRRKTRRWRLYWTSKGGDLGWMPRRCVCAEMCVDVSVCLRLCVSVHVCFTFTCICRTHSHPLTY